MSGLDVIKQGKDIIYDSIDNLLYPFGKPPEKCKWHSRCRDKPYCDSCGEFIERLPSCPIGEKSACEVHEKKELCIHYEIRHGAPYCSLCEDYVKDFAKDCGYGTNCNCGGHTPHIPARRRRSNPCI